MEKFCAQCGRTLDPATGKCPGCTPGAGASFFRAADDLGSTPINRPMPPVAAPVRSPERTGAPAAPIRASAPAVTPPKAPVMTAPAVATTPEKPKARKKGVIIGISAAALCLLLVVGALFLLDPFSSAPQTGAFEMIDGSEVSRKIHSADDAKKALGDLSSHFGVENAEEIFEESASCSVGNLSCYRFDQEYEGIPVYGRAVTVTADGSGSCVDTVGNYIALDGVATEPTITEETAVSSVENTLSEDAEAYGSGLTIYTLENHAPELSYQVEVFDGLDSKRVFVSAISGQVLDELPTAYTGQVRGSGIDLHVKNEERDFWTEQDGNTYYLWDTERNIQVYDANESTLEKVDFVRGSDGQLYGHIDDKNNGNIEYWFEFPFIGKEVTLDTSTYGVVKVYNSKGELLDDSAHFVLSIRNIEPVTSQKPDWFDAEEVTLMYSVSTIHDFWKSEWKRNGYDDHGGPLVVVNRDNKKPINAYCSSRKNSGYALLSFGTDTDLSYDSIAHEYMHAVESNISGMTYQGESGALMEAYSDIFGELFEDLLKDGEFNGSMDWYHSWDPVDEKKKDALDDPDKIYLSRNIAKPQRYNQPARYQDENWKDTKNPNKDNDYGYVHINNTVISHAAYLMYQGIEDDDEFEPLSILKIADLFYATLYRLPSDCTFERFAKELRIVAGTMENQGELSTGQLLCVREALQKVGLGGSKSVEKPAEDHGPVSEAPAQPEPEIVDLSGDWEHEEYPDPYSLTLERQTDGTYNIYIEADSLRRIHCENVAIHMGTALLKHVDLSSGRAEVPYIDSFENTGIVTITTDGTTIRLEYDVDEPRDPLWGIDFGEGTYVRASENPQYDIDLTALAEYKTTLTQTATNLMSCCLYDIDKDGHPELILREGPFPSGSYLINICIKTTNGVFTNGSFAISDDLCEYDGGNGMLSREGSKFYLSEDQTIWVEPASNSEVQASWNNYLNFYPISDLLPLL